MFYLSVTDKHREQFIRKLTKELPSILPSIVTVQSTEQIKILSLTKQNRVCHRLFLHVLFSELQRNLQMFFCVCLTLLPLHIIPNI